LLITTKMPEYLLVDKAGWTAAGGGGSNMQVASSVCSAKCHDKRALSKHHHQSVPTLFLSSTCICIECSLIAVYPPAASWLAYNFLGSGRRRRPRCAAMSQAGWVVVVVDWIRAEYKCRGRRTYELGQSWRPPASTSVDDDPTLVTLHLHVEDSCTETDDDDETDHRWRTKRRALLFYFSVLRDANLVH